MLSLHLLGAPELRRDGQPLPLAIKKTWALLLVLACAGRTLRPRLAAQLWPDLDEPSARRNLRRELARLREAGADALVQAEGDWLALAGEAACDLADFEAALDRGDVDTALALWRGPLADGLALGDAPEFDRWLDVQRERLRGHWRGALQAVAERAPPERALAHWQALLDDDPLQEQHHRALMRLHAAAGRREAALAQYERCRSLLRDELDLAPVAETEAIAAALRSTSPLSSPSAQESLQSSRSSEPPDPPGAAAGDRRCASRTALRPDALPDLLPFVGRSAEVAAMEAAWRERRMVIIEGAGGIGKTRLALDFAAAHGAYALARCRSGDRDVPYAAWTRALRALAGPQPTRETFAALPPWTVDEVSRLLPELGPAGSVPAPIRSDDERSRFVEAQAAAWQTLCADSFDAVVLDDWHHADAASRSLLAFVVQRRLDGEAGGRAAAGNAACAREIVLLRPDLNTEAAASWRALREGTRALHLVLPALPADVLLDLVRRLSRAGDPSRFAARLQAATAGNPFFVAETLRHWLGSGLIEVGADGAWRTRFDNATKDYRELPVPGSVRDAVLARVQRLSEASQRVLEAAALAAEPFAPALLAPACALSELDAVLAIEHAAQAQLLREHEAGGFGFAHDLVQQALESSLSADRRRLVHRRLALGAEVAGAPAALIAAHHEASGDARRAVAHRLHAAEQAMRLHALPEAMLHWRRALADGAEPRQALRCHQGLMLAARMRCEFDVMLDEGTALQRLAGEGTALSADERAEALIAVADNLVVANRAAETLQMLDRLPALHSEPVRARALMTRARALQGLGRLEDCKAAAQAALDLPALPTRDRLHLLDMLCVAEFGAADTAAARRHADAGLALALEVADEESAACARMRRGLAWLVEGDLPRAQGELMQAAESFERRGSVYRLRHVLYNLCVLYEAQNQHALALEVIRRGWELRPEMPRGEIWMMYRLAFVDAHVALGQFGAAWEHAQAAIDVALAQNEPAPLFAATQGALELLGLLGETELARRVLAATAAATDRSKGELRQMSAECWIVATQFEMAQGDVAAAQAALSRCPPAAELPNPRVRVRHALAQAELRLLQGDVAAAAATLPDGAAEGHNDEMRARALAIAVRAQAHAGALQAATAEAAIATLQRPSPYAPATLQLHRALAQAQRAGQSGAWDGALRAHRGFAATLAQSLQAHPAQQAAFARRVAV